MKPIQVLFIAIILCTLTTNAQITKGNWMVGGYGNFSSKKYISKAAEGYTSVERSFKISPNIGFFPIDKLAVGLRLGYEGVFRPRTNNYVGDQSNTITAGPFVRYYFLKPEKIFNFFMEGNFRLGNTNLKSGLQNQNFKRKESEYGIVAGPVIYFNNSVSMELTLQYLSSKKENDDINLTTNDFQIGLGFQIYLEKNN